MNKKPNVKKFTPHDTGKLLWSNHDDLLEVQYGGGDSSVVRAPDS